MHLFLLPKSKGFHLYYYSLPYIEFFLSSFISLIFRLLDSFLKLLFLCFIVIFDIFLSSEFLLFPLILILGEKKNVKFFL